MLKSAEVEKQLDAHGIIALTEEEKIFYSELDAIEYAKEKLKNKVHKKHFWNIRKNEKE